MTLVKLAVTMICLSVLTLTALIRVLSFVSDDNLFAEDALRLAIAGIQLVLAATATIACGYAITGLS